MSVGLAIVGAGPAGMAAAVEAAEHGLSVTVLDDQPEPGGQIYRGIERAEPGLCAILGEEYEAGRALAADFRKARIDYRPGSAVWRLDAGARIAYSREGSASTVSARRVLIATGAMERPVPIPGAERPGVMGAGAAQVLLKASGLVPAGRIVLAGSGPLLLLVGCQLLDAGAEVAAVLETTESADYLDAAPALPRALAGWRDLAKGVTMKRRLRRAGVAFRSGVSGLAATGESVRFDGGEIACDLLLLHEGVVPQTHLSRQAGLAHRWRPEQRHWAPVSDSLGRTADETLLIAGDAGGIAGARAAALSGRGRGQAGSGRGPGRAGRRAEPGARHAAAARPPVPAPHRLACGRGAGLPLREHHGRRYPPGGSRRGDGPQPAQGLRPHRHGPLPGAHVRARRRRSHRQ